MVSIRDKREIAFLEWILMHPTPNTIDWGGIGLNPYLRIEHVLEHPNKPWDWWTLSMNPNITRDHKIYYRDLPWVSDPLSVCSGEPSASRPQVTNSAPSFVSDPVAKSECTVM